MLELSRSSYYKRKHREEGKRHKENQFLLEQIKEVFSESKERYGSPRITAELKRRGISCNKKRIARIMRKNGIEARIFRKYKVTTNSNHQKEVSANLLDRDFSKGKPNIVWTSDITYIRTEEGWLYLAAIMDTYSRKVVGWQLDNRINSGLIEPSTKKKL